MKKLSAQEVAKMAAKTIRSLEIKNRELAAENVQYSEKLATLSKERECFVLAKEMADRGQIDCSVESVEKTAAVLVTKDLAVVKEAMTLAPSLTQIGEPTSGSTPASGADQLVETILGLAQ